MRLVFAISCLIAALVFAYCYFKRNKSIKESGRFWRSLTFMFGCLSANFTLRHFDQHTLWIHAAIFTVFGYFLHDILKTSLSNITGSWSTVKNKEEIEEIESRWRRDNEILRNKINTGKMSNRTRTAILKALELDAI